jgi:hypothetical protein
MGKEEEFLALSFFPAAPGIRAISLQFKRMGSRRVSISIVFWSG